MGLSITLFPQIHQSAIIPLALLGKLVDEDSAKVVVGVCIIPPAVKSVAVSWPCFESLHGEGRPKAPLGRKNASPLRLRVVSLGGGGEKGVEFKLNSLSCFVILVFAGP